MRRFALILSLACASLQAQTVTFSQQVAPILYQFCAPCHRPGEAAPFSLLSFEDAKKHATQIARVTKQRYMPPWPPAAGHGDFAGARRLSEEQIEVLSKWAASGMAEGDSAAAPPSNHCSLILKTPAIAASTASSVGLSSPASIMARASSSNRLLCCA